MINGGGKQMTNHLGWQQVQASGVTLEILASLPLTQWFPNASIHEIN